MHLACFDVAVCGVASLPTAKTCRPSSSVSAGRISSDDCDFVSARQAGAHQVCPLFFVGWAPYLGPGLAGIHRPRLLATHRVQAIQASISLPHAPPLLLCWHKGPHLPHNSTLVGFPPAAPGRLQPAAMFSSDWWQAAQKQAMEAAERAKALATQATEQLAQQAQEFAAAAEQATEKAKVYAEQASQQAQVGARHRGPTSRLPGQQGRPAPDPCMRCGGSCCHRQPLLPWCRGVGCATGRCWPSRPRSRLRARSWR